jgi:hypothetical protein
MEKNGHTLWTLILNCAKKKACSLILSKQMLLSNQIFNY